jgi:hypothetical protein
MSSNSTYSPSAWNTSQNLIYLQPVNSDNTLGNVYVFDCYFSGDIVSELHKTQHPVQTGANISDHAFLLPVTINFDIGMSDAGKSFNSSWDGASTKSVNALQTLRDWQKNRTFVNCVTKFGATEHLLVERVNPHLTVKTIYGLRASITLGQVYLVSISATTVSARPAATSSTSQGSINTGTVSAATTANNKTTGATPKSESKDSWLDRHAREKYPGIPQSWANNLYKFFNPRDGA